MGFRSTHAKEQFLAERMCWGMPSAVSCAKMAEQIEMLFGFWTRGGPNEAAAVRPYVILL